MKLTTPAAAGGPSALPLLFDSHCHLQDETFQSKLAMGPDGARLIPSVSGMTLMSTSEEDWAATTEASAVRRAAGLDCRLALGVHPWWASAVVDGWEQRLRERLLAAPGAIVGEVGLDGLPPREGRPFSPLAEQQPVFAAAMRVAAETRRPASLHCVKATQPLLEALRALPALPPALLLHAYGGSLETAAQLTRLASAAGTRVYFGFGASCARSPKTLRVVAQLPEEALLLESDQHAEAASAQDLLSAAAAVGGARGWSVADTARLTTRNAVAAMDPERWGGGVSGAG